MSSSICIASSSTNDTSAVQVAADISEHPKRDRQRRLYRSEEILFRRKEPERAREMAREMSQFCKRPSELRSRRTPKGTIIRVSDLDQQDSDRMLEEDSSSRMSKEENAAQLDERRAGGTSQNSTLDSNPKVIEVPLLSLVVNKRKGKSKALIDDYDLIPKPGSRAIITLDDEDQEFVDAWYPDSYIEPQQDLRYPLYSDVLRGSLDTT